MARGILAAVNFPEPQSTEPSPRPPVPTLADALGPQPERREKFQPRYVELREHREQGRGPRNLALGVAAFLAAVVLLAASMVLGGPRGLFAIAVGLVTFTVLYVLARLHIFRQRHGVFLAVGVVSLLGATFALCDRALAALHRFVSTPAVVAQSPPAPVPTMPDPLPPLLTESFAITPPEAKSGPRVRALRDSRVPIDGKQFLIKAGDIFPLAEVKGEEVSFKVRDLRIVLPASAVEVLGAVKKEPAKVAEAAPAPAPEPKPSPETTTAEVTRHAQQEAVKRYPALGVEGSRENILFVTTFRELKDNADDFFKNAEWPLELAELLAKREGWRRDDGPKQPPPPAAPAPKSRSKPEATLPELPPEAR